MYILQFKGKKYLLSDQFYELLCSWKIVLVLCIVNMTSIYTCTVHVIIPLLKFFLKIVSIYMYMDVYSQIYFYNRKD